MCVSHGILGDTKMPARHDVVRLRAKRFSSSGS